MSRLIYGVGYIGTIGFSKQLQNIPTNHWSQYEIHVEFFQAHLNDLKGHTWQSQINYNKKLVCEVQELKPVCVLFVQSFAPRESVDCINFSVAACRWVNNLMVFLFHIPYKFYEIQVVFDKFSRWT